jgi:hypothetical protein
MRGKFFLSLALVLAAASSASAGVSIYSDFGGGSGYTYGTGYTVSGSNSVAGTPKNQAIGADFTVSSILFPSGARLGDVILAIGEIPVVTSSGNGSPSSPFMITSQTYGTDSFNVAIETSVLESGKQEPSNTAVETWNNVAIGQITATPKSPTTNKQITYSGSTITLDSPFNALLNAGQEYWVVVTPDDPTATAQWAETSNQGIIDPATGNLTNNPITWNDALAVAPAFQLNTSPVPMPAALPGGLVLMAGLFGAKWFKKATAK